MIKVVEFDKEADARFKADIPDSLKHGFPIKYSIKEESCEIRIKRYFPQVCRFIIVAYALVFLFFLFFVWGVDDLVKGVKKDWEWRYDFDRMAEEYYYTHSAYNEYKTLDETKEILRKRHLSFNLYFWLFVIFVGPVFYIFLGSRRTPVAVNKKYRLIYTWHRGRLFYHPLDSKLEYHNLMVEEIRLDKSKGISFPLKIKLTDSRDPKKTRLFTVGAMLDPCSQQFYPIGRTILAYLCKANYDTDDQWLKNALGTYQTPFSRAIYTFTSFSFRKGANLDSPKVQQAVQEVLVKYPPTQPEDNFFEAEREYFKTGRFEGDELLFPER
jgi:hypothetical protein